MNTLFTRTKFIVFLFPLLFLAIAPVCFAETIEKMEEVVSKARNISDFLDQPTLIDEYFKTLESYYGKENFHREAYDKIIEQLRMVNELNPSLAKRLWATTNLGSEYSISNDLKSHGREFHRSAYNTEIESWIDKLDKSVGEMTEEEVKRILSEKDVSIREFQSGLDPNFGRARRAQAQGAFFGELKKDKEFSSALDYLVRHQLQNSKDLSNTLYEGNSDLILSELGRFRTNTESINWDTSEIKAPRTIRSLLGSRFPAQSHWLRKEEVFERVFVQNNHGKTEEEGSLKEGPINFRPIPRRIHGIWKGMYWEECVGGCASNSTYLEEWTSPERWATIALKQSTLHLIEQNGRFLGWAHTVPVLIDGRRYESIEVAAKIFQRDGFIQDPATGKIHTTPIYDMWMRKVQALLPNSSHGFAMSTHSNADQASVKSKIQETYSFKFGRLESTGKNVVYLDPMGLELPSVIPRYGNQILGRGVTEITTTSAWDEHLVIFSDLPYQVGTQRSLSTEEIQKYKVEQRNIIKHFYVDWDYLASTTAWLVQCAQTPADMVLAAQDPSVGFNSDSQYRTRLDREVQDQYERFFALKPSAGKVKAFADQVVRSPEGLAAYLKLAGEWAINLKRLYVVFTIGMANRSYDDNSNFERVREEYIVSAIPKLERYLRKKVSLKTLTEVISDYPSGIPKVQLFDLVAKPSEIGMDQNIAFIENLNHEGSRKAFFLQTIKPQINNLERLNASKDNAYTNLFSDEEFSKLASELIKPNTSTEALITFFGHLSSKDIKKSFFESSVEANIPDLKKLDALLEGYYLTDLYTPEETATIASRVISRMGLPGGKGTPSLSKLKEYMLTLNSSEAKTQFFGAHVEPSVQNLSELVTLMDECGIDSSRAKDPWFTSASRLVNGTNSAKVISSFMWQIDTEEAKKAFFESSAELAIDNLEKLTSLFSEFPLNGLYTAEEMATIASRIIERMGQPGGLGLPSQDKLIEFYNSLTSNDAKAQFYVDHMKSGIRTVTNLIEVFNKCSSDPLSTEQLEAIVKETVAEGNHTHEQLREIMTWKWSLSENTTGSILQKYWAKNKDIEALRELLVYVSHSNLTAYLPSESPAELAENHSFEDLVTFANKVWKKDASSSEYTTGLAKAAVKAASQKKQSLATYSHLFSFGETVLDILPETPVDLLTGTWDVADLNNFAHNLETLGQPGKSYRDKLLIEALHKITTEEEFREMKLPSRGTRSAELQRVIEEVAASKGWKKGFFYGVCNFGKL